MLDYSLLEHPHNLPAIHGVPSKTVELPANNALRLALADTGKHFAENGASGHFSRLFFYKLFGYRKPFLLGQSPQNGKLVFNRPDLLIFNIGRFTGVEEINRHKFIVL
jgi:hypothetical protein